MISPFFLQKVFSNCNNLICWRTVWFVGGKTRNITLQLALQQVARFCFPFYRSFISWFRYSRSRELLCSLVMTERVVEARLYFCPLTFCLLTVQNVIWKFCRMLSFATSGSKRVNIRSWASFSLGFHPELWRGGGYIYNRVILALMKLLAQ